MSEDTLQGQFHSFKFEWSNLSFDLYIFRGEMVWEVSI